MKSAGVTAFGAAFGQPAQTAAVLRARAAALGLDTRTTQVGDLTAAVVAAQAWLVALRQDTLGRAGDPAAAAALAGVLCRAAGHATRPVPPPGPDRDRRLEALTRQLPATRQLLAPQALARVTEAVEWAFAHGGDVGVLVAAAEDLAPGWGHDRLAAVSDVLLTLACD